MYYAPSFQSDDNLISNSTCKIFSMLRSVNNIINSWKRIVVCRGNIVEGSTISTHTLCIIFIKTPIQWKNHMEIYLVQSHFVSTLNDHSSPMIDLKYNPILDSEASEWSSILLLELGAFLWMLKKCLIVINYNCCLWLLEQLHTSMKGYSLSIFFVNNRTKKLFALIISWLDLWMPKNFFSCISINWSCRFDHISQTCTC